MAKIKHRNILLWLIHVTCSTKRAWTSKTWTRNFNIKAQEHSIHSTQGLDVSSQTVCFHTCSESARKTDGPHRGDAEACGQFEIATSTNYAYMVILRQRVLEFVPADSDREPDVLKVVFCLVWCMLESKSNNGCEPVYVQHIRVGPQRLLPFAAPVLCEAN